MFVRSLSLAGLLAGFALAAAPAAHAQTTTAPDPAMAAQGQGRMAGRQAEMMKALNLTDDQKTKVEALMTENRAAMMNRPSGPPDAAQRDAMRARRADMDAKLQTILTPEQYTKYQAMRPQRGQQPKEN